MGLNVGVKRWGQLRKRHLPDLRKVPLTLVGLTGTAGAPTSYLGGHFGSQHHVPRQRKDSLGFAGESFSFVGLTGFEPATT